MSDSLNGFENREKTFEAKYLHDEELHFRIKVRRNHLFGLWAAQLLGYTGDKAEAYTEEVIMMETQKSHLDDVLHKVLKDFQDANVGISEHRVRKKLAKCWGIAEKMIMNDEEF